MRLHEPGAVSIIPCIIIILWCNNTIVLNNIEHLTERYMVLQQYISKWLEYIAKDHTCSDANNIVLT